MKSNGRRSNNIDVTVMLIVVFVAVALQRAVPDVENTPLFVAVSVLTARGVYDLLIQAIYWTIRNDVRLLRLYWGRLYLAGIWSYTYELSGRQYFGVWRIEQDDKETRVLGIGLHDTLKIRTMVRSVSPLIEEYGAWFVLNDRIEFDPGPPATVPIEAVAASEPKFNESEPTYSKTTLIFDGPRVPRSMRATTYIFGGPSSGQIHTDVVFRKHEGCESFDGAIEILASELGVRLEARNGPPAGGPARRGA